MEPEGKVPSVVCVRSAAHIFYCAFSLYYVLCQFSQLNPVFKSSDISALETNQKNPVDLNQFIFGFLLKTASIGDKSAK